MLKNKLLLFFEIIWFVVCLFISNLISYCVVIIIIIIIIINYVFECIKYVTYSQYITNHSRFFFNFMSVFSNNNNNNNHTLFYSLR
jgi:hypothetical protein